MAQQGIARKKTIAQVILRNKGSLKEARATLLTLMDDNESFDFQINENNYRCWKRPTITVQRPKINKDEGTFTMQDVVVSPTIFIRKIRPRIIRKED